LASYRIQFTSTAIVRVRYISLRITSIGTSMVVLEKVIDFIKISTKKNLADIMTKTIPVEKFRASLNFINVLQR